MATVRAYTPASGELSEQFDRVTGQQTSAKNLAWSHAALITAVAARRATVSQTFCNGLSAISRPSPPRPSP